MPLPEKWPGHGAGQRGAGAAKGHVRRQWGAEAGTPDIALNRHRETNFLAWALIFLLPQALPPLLIGAGRAR